MKGTPKRLAEAVCPSCGLERTTWEVEQERGRLRVCAKCLHLETEGQVEGLAEVRARKVWFLRDKVAPACGRRTWEGVSTPSPARSYRALVLAR